MISTVGFDLDMTLVDTAEGIVDTIEHVLSLHGVTADREDLAATIGLPLDHVFPHYVDVEYAVLLEQYRARYATHAIALSTPLPGAAAALAAVRARGHRVLVVTAKKKEQAIGVLEAAGLDHLVDVVVGERFSEAKGEVLIEHAAWAYVGDHLGDVIAARVAGAVAVGVPTGPTTAEQLLAEGADVVLESLLDFPDWIKSQGAAQGP